MFGPVAEGTGLQEQSGHRSGGENPQADTGPLAQRRGHWQAKCDEKGRPTMSSANASLVPAVFRDRTSAEAAVDALQLASIARDDIGLAVPLRAPNRIREDSGAEALAGAGR